MDSRKRFATSCRSEQVARSHAALASHSAEFAHGTGCASHASAVPGSPETAQAGKRAHDDSLTRRRRRYVAVATSAALGRGAFSFYRSQLSSQTTLTPDQERDLATRWRGGDQLAGQKM